MSLLSWLFPPKSKPVTASAGSAAQAAAAESAKGERTQRREHLYLAVRDAMVRSGVLSSGYKFKVLSLDPDGRQFLVMIDIAPGYGADTARQAEMEALLTQTARARFHVEVAAVYWRVSAALGGPDKPAVAVAPAAAVAKPAATPVPPQVATPPVVAPAPQAKSDFEPIAPDEVEAFQKALQQAAAPKPAVAQPPLRRPAQEASDNNGFADTMIVDDDGQTPRLGATQYGALR
ncbi:MAG: hypothetical protein ABS45_03920 [Comamonas sp. SCN 65-56]|uniref:hypothetical protein n=1 Tax=Comamonas sp. SCN 65-56 TaxID=1660095 RepID=UPI00086D7D33|nr:hypothetical protein [Comamonas sp. SCN 65-56]ODS93048.1 MAG: hypothetical protein ABS45_03920 [Comamonas sp. SCN 65-56]